MSLTKPEINNRLTFSLGCYGCSKSFRCTFGGLFCTQESRNTSGPYGCNKISREKWLNLLGKIENKTPESSKKLTPVRATKKDKKLQLIKGKRGR
jgi:hypothetical protein